MVADAPPRRGCAGEDAVAAWYAARGYEVVDRELARARRRDRSGRARGRRLGRVLRGQDPPRRRVRAPRRGRHRHEAATAAAARAACGSPTHPVPGAELRFDVAVGAAGRRGRLVDRRARSRVLSGASVQRRFAAGPAPALGPPAARCASAAAPRASRAARRPRGPARPDLVVAARAAVGLHRLVRLDVAYVFAVVVAAVGVRPVVFGHRCSVIGGRRPRPRARDDHERDDDDGEVAAPVRRACRTG